jgi:glutamine synthetase
MHNMTGTTKYVAMPANAEQNTFEDGLGFDGSLFEGFSRIQESDMWLMLDTVTHKPAPPANLLPREMLVLVNQVLVFIQKQTAQPMNTNNL